MKILTFALFLSLSAIAWDGRKVILDGTNTLGTTYATNGRSLMLSELSASNKHLAFMATIPDVACKVGVSSTVAPDTVTSGNWKEVLLIASERTYMHEVGDIPNIYCRSTSATKITGEISVVAW